MEEWNKPGDEQGSTYILLPSEFPICWGGKKRKPNHQNDVAHSGPVLYDESGEKVQTGATYWYSWVFGEEQGNTMSEESATGDSGGRVQDEILPPPIFYCITWGFMHLQMRGSKRDLKTPRKLHGPNDYIPLYYVASRSKKTKIAFLI